MIPSHDATKGDRFRVTTKLKENPTFEVVYIKQRSDGQVVFNRCDSGKRWYIPCADFILMWQRDKTMIRLDPDELVDQIEVLPGSFEPIDELGDSPHQKARKKKYLKLITQGWYLNLIDARGIRSSIPNFEALINDPAIKALHSQLGLLDYGYASSTLVKLCREVGERNNRPRAELLDGPRGGDQRSGNWADFVLKAKREMLDRFYSAAAPSEADVKSEFKAKLAAKASSMPLESRGFKRPASSTLDYWLQRARTDKNMARREGQQVVNRQIGGVHPIVMTQRPLEVVVLDHTQIDMNVVVLDAHGKVIDRVVRPYLIVIVDVHTRMIQAANLSLEPPSLHTLFNGVRQALQPKQFDDTIQSGGAYDWARDGFGKFARGIVDNGLENIGRSMQSAARFVGLHVSFAPVRTGEYKAIAERLFKMLNTKLWHLAKGGVDFKPSEPRPFDPRDKAEFTLAEAQRELWRFIVEVYHLSKHDALDYQPALMWKEAWKTWKRPMMHDMGTIEKVFGRLVVRHLTTSGFQYRNQFFHAPSVVDPLLADLYYLVGGKRSKRQKHNTVSIEVDITVFDDDVTHIVVFNAVRRTHVVIPNRNRAAVGSYDAQADIDVELHRTREAFIPEDEVTQNYDKIVSVLARRPEIADEHTSPRSSPAAKINAINKARSAPRRKPKPPKNTTPAGKGTVAIKSAAERKPKTDSNDIEHKVSAADAKENMSYIVELGSNEPAPIRDIGAMRERIWAEMEMKSKL